jgi:hypothetical protein
MDIVSELAKLVMLSGTERKVESQWFFLLDTVGSFGKLLGNECGSA